MIKTYYFIDDSWFDNPCDCCEGIWMDCYNIDHTEHPEFFQNGSAHSLEDCWRDVLEYEGVIGEDFEGCSQELKRLMLANNLRVVII